MYPFENHFNPVSIRSDQNQSLILRIAEGKIHIELILDCKKLDRTLGSNINYLIHYITALQHVEEGKR